MSCEDDGELRRGPWTLQEDNLLIHYIASCGEGNWNLLAKRSGLKRTGKSCRLRWLNYLKPDVKRGNLSSQEQLLILQLHLRWGNRWSKIAQQLPGRTDNEIKNYWRTKIHKQGRHMKMDTNSRAFQDMVRCFWIPRLLQKIQHSQNSIDQPPQAQAQAQAPDMGQTTIQEVNQHEYQVYSDQSTSSGITCSDSINTFQVSDISNNNLFNSSESCLGAACSIENFPIENCQMVKSNWVDSCFPDDGYWDCGMDELWQFSNIM